MSSNRRIVIVDEDDDKKLNLSTRGLLDVLSVEIVDGNGNQISSFGGSGGTSHADDAAFSIGSASSLTPIGYLADEASPDSVDEGDVGVPRMTLTRKPYAVISNPTGEINATVLDYTNSNPVAVRLSDANGDYVAAGAGTQYTEDAAAAADPVGGTIMMTRDDQISTVTEAEGDWSRARGTSKGALWVALADASGDPITSFGGGTQYAVDAALGATPTGTLSLAKRDDALSALTPVEADAVELRVDGEGALWVKHSGTMTVDGSGVTQPVSGTFWQATQPVSLASVPSHAVTNAGTFAVQISDPSFAVADGNALGEGVLVQGDDGTDRKNINVDATTGDVQVDVTNTVTVDLAGNNDVTVTSGAITETNSGTIAGDTTSIDGKITACNTGAVVLAAGTAGIGKLTANSGVDIGDVDILSLPADTFVVENGALGKGVLLQGDDGTDRKNVLVDASGHLQIDVISAPSTAVTGTFWQATQPVSGTVTANLGATDNGVLDTIDAVLDTINAKLVSGTDIGDVTINNAAGAAAVNIQDGGNTITVDGTVTANLSATDNGVLDQIELNTDPLLIVGGGTEAAAIRVTIANNSTGVLSIDDGGGALTVDGTVTANLSATDNAVLDTIDAVLDAIKIDTEAIETAVEGTLTVDLAGNNDVTVTSGTIDVLGNVAHDAADSGDPVKIGGKAQSHLAAPAEVSAANDRVNSLFDRVGRQAVYQGYVIKSAVINCSTSGNNTIVAAVATKRIRVLSVAIISDGTTDVRWESGAGGAALTGQMPLQEREGYTISNPWGLFETAAVNTLMNLELTAAINVHGFISYIEVDD